MTTTLAHTERKKHTHISTASALQLAFREQRGVFTIPSDANAHYLTRINVLPAVKGQLTISNASQLEKNEDENVRKLYFSRFSNELKAFRRIYDVSFDIKIY
jgi:uncharacterized protein YhbP (UPF0306 family)